MNNLRANLPAPAVRSTAIDAILVIALIVAAGLRMAVVTPAHAYLLDYRAYYATGRALALGVNPYDADAVRAAVQLPGQQPILMYVYPPPTLPLVWALAHLPYPAAQVPWALLQFGLGLAALLLLARTLGCGLGSPATLLLAYAFFLGRPAEELFRWGQIDMLVLAFVAAALYATVRGRSTAAGFWIGLAALTKITPAALLLVFVLRRDWKAVFAGGVTIVALLGASYVILGHGAFVQWQINLRQQPEALAPMISPNNMSLHGYLLRALAEAPEGVRPSQPWVDAGPQAARLIAWTLAALLWGLTSAWLLRHRREINTAAALAAFVPVILLTSPVTWAHHGVLMLVPLAVIVAAAAGRSRLAPLDVGWLALAVVMLTVWPVQQYDLQLPDWLRHLAAPTFTYGVALVWLFIVLRYVPWTRAAAQPATSDDAPALHVPAGLAPQWSH